MDSTQQHSEGHFVIHNMNYEHLASISFHLGIQDLDSIILKYVAKKHTFHSSNFVCYELDYCEDGEMETAVMVWCCIKSSLDNNIGPIILISCIFPNWWLLIN